MKKMNEKYNMSELLDIVYALDDAWNKFFELVIDVEIPISSAKYFMTFQYKLEELKKFMDIEK